MFLLILQLLFVATRPHSWGPAQPPPRPASTPTNPRTRAGAKGVAERLESELVDRMVNHIAAELATDIKQILSVKERREALRGIARDHMFSIMKAGA